MHNNLANVRSAAWSRTASGLCAFLSVVAATLTAQAATLYVDGNCPSSGSGLSTACGGTGPKRSIDEGLALLRAGDVLQIRGVHAAHNGETAPFDGRYFQNEHRVTVTGTATSPVIIQPYGYTGPGTGESVFLDGSRPPSDAWQRCSDCTIGTCAGVPAAACSETWFASDNGTAPSGWPFGSANLVVWAQKDDGSVTYRVSSPGDLTNSHGNYNPKRCNNETWRACVADRECSAGGTCTATSPEVDSYSPGSGGPTLVRWGAQLPTKPYVLYNQAGDAFALKSSSAFVTIRGFTMRAHYRSSVFVDPNSTNNSLVDNRIFYNVGSGGGSYGISAIGTSQLTIAGNDIGYTGDEGIHTQARADNSPTVIFIRGNWVHDQGDASVLGIVGGTPSGMTLSHEGATNANNYTGSIVEGNVINNQRKNTGSPGYGMRLENASTGWIVRDNLFVDPDAQCIDLDGSDGISDNNQIYNNIFVGCGRAGINLYCEAPSGAVRNTLIYNNTFVNTSAAAISVENSSGSCGGNIVRNNIFYDSGAKQLVNWPMAGVFQNNLVYSTSSGTLVSINGRSFGCGSLIPAADIDGDGTINDGVRCANPQFRSVSARDFHLTPGSLAIEAGTGTGMPAGRTTSLNNSLAGRVALPPYADNTAKQGVNWDVGAIEYFTAGPTAAITLTDPSPTAAGSVGLTLTTSVSVVSIPAALSFLDSGGGSKVVLLSGTVPGNVFTGSLVVDSTVADGLGTFQLAPGSLVDAQGNSGNQITAGGQTLIDKTPPAAPSNVTVGG